MQDKKTYLLGECRADLEAAISATNLGATVVAVDDEFGAGFSVVLDDEAIGGIRIERCGSGYVFRYLPTDEAYFDEWQRETQVQLYHTVVIHQIFAVFYRRLIDSALARREALYFGGLL